MNQTPVKTLPVTLTSVHQLSVQKSKAIYEQTQNFMDSNFKKSHEGTDQKMAQSTESLSNTKAFFESELQLVLRMVEQSNKLYQEKENENLELTKKVKQYECMIAKLKKTVDEQTHNKGSNMTTAADQNDEMKTRKKTLSSLAGLTKSQLPAPSEFTVGQSSQLKKPELQGMKRKHQKMVESQDDLESSEQSNPWNKEFLQFTCELASTKGKNEKIFDQLNSVKQQKQKLQTKYSTLEKDHSSLTSKHSILQQRYKDLEDKHGKTVAEYEIKLQNLKSLLKGIHDQASPKKFSQKLNEGYYSINRPLNRTESQESFGSQNPSKEYALSHVQSNLREENEYLRTQLIKVLDDKGEIQMKYNKYKKLAVRLEAQLKQVKKRNSKSSTHQSDQNNQDISNLDETKSGQKSAQSFKKNKNVSVLVVQNTQKIQKEILEELKIKNLFRQIDSLLDQQDQTKTEIEFQSRSTQIQFLQNVLQTIKKHLREIDYLKAELSRTQDQNKNLNMQIFKIQQKEKKDTDMKNNQKSPSENSSVSKSRDSTENRFNKMRLIFEERKQKILDEFSNSTQKLVNSMLLHQFETQNAHLKAQIKTLKQEMACLEGIIQDLMKEIDIEKLQKREEQENRRKEKGQLVPYSPSKQTCQDVKSLDYSPFDMFKQKLTEFYQQTIKQLDDWSKSAFKSLPSPNKRQPEAQNQQRYSIPQLEIPSIVGKNIMKMSQEFKSIQNSSFDKQSATKNEEYAKMHFQEQKLSQSFIKEESCESDNLQEVINKKFEDLQQFSSNWISKLISKDVEKNDLSGDSSKVPDLTLKQVAREHHEIVIMKAAKTDRSANEKKYPFECDLEGIDCVSEEMTESQIMSEKRIFIREEVSYFVQKNEKMDGLLHRCKSKSSFGSFNG